MCGKKHPRRLHGNAFWKFCTFCGNAGTNREGAGMSFSECETDLSLCDGGGSQDQSGFQQAHGAVVISNSPSLLFISTIF